ncbi:MAG: hypothetical protein EUB_02383 [Eubacterium sp.]|uniref:hypothetical protein n=1 Tax=Eubacterium sp. TaxID=142586 RepID=UPI00303FBCF1
MDNMNIKNHKFIVFAIDHYNPLGAVRSLGQLGINPVVIAVKHTADLAVKSKYASVCHKVASVEEGYEILMSQYGQEDVKPFLITCDDKTTGYLDEQYNELKDKFICFNAGEAGRITKFMDKKIILELAEKYGLKVLKSTVVEKDVVPEGLDYPIITKSISPNVGGWKSDVHICKSEEELIEAYKTIESPEVLIQKYIEKKNEYCLDGFTSNKGKNFFVGIASEYKYLIPGYYSPYYEVFNFDDVQLNKALSGMMEEIGFEGIFSIEFLIDQDGTKYFTEINFRNSTWSYASTCAGMNLPELWAKSMISGEIETDWKKDIEEGFTAMVEPIDYSKRVKAGTISLFEWLADFKGANCTHYYVKEDLEPYYEMVRNIKRLS